MNSDIFYAYCPATAAADRRSSSGHATYERCADDHQADDGGERTPSTLISRNVIFGNKRTSIRLEPAYWEALRVIVKREAVTLNDLCTRIDRLQLCSSFTAAVRVVVLRYFWQPEVRRALFPDRLYHAIDYGTRASEERLHRGYSDGQQDDYSRYANRPHAIRQRGRS